MVEIELRVVDSPDTADRVARRLVREMGDTSGIAEAKLVRRPAEAGERGIVDEIGKLAVNVATGGGAEALIGAVKGVLLRDANREMVVKLPDGTEFTLKGGSEAQFGRATDVVLALIARGAGGEKA